MTTKTIKEVQKGLCRSAAAGELAHSASGFEAADLLASVRLARLPKETKTSLPVAAVARALVLPIPIMERWAQEGKLKTDPGTGRVSLSEIARVAANLSQYRMDSMESCLEGMAELLKCNEWDLDEDPS